MMWLIKLKKVLTGKAGMYKNTSIICCTLIVSGKKSDKTRKKIPEVFKGKLFIQVACDELAFSECLENV